MKVTHRQMALLHQLMILMGLADKEVLVSLEVTSQANILP